jgi:hypothetical protein
VGKCEGLVAVVIQLRKAGSGRQAQLYFELFGLRDEAAIIIRRGFVDYR